MRKQSWWSVVELNVRALTRENRILFSKKKVFENFLTIVKFNEFLLKEISLFNKRFIINFISDIIEKVKRTYNRT